MKKLETPKMTRCVWCGFNFTELTEFPTCGPCEAEGMGMKWGMGSWEKMLKMYEENRDERPSLS